MALPRVVTDYLEELGIPYETVSGAQHAACQQASSASAQQIALMRLIQSSGSSLEVITPAQAVLDLNRLAEHLGSKDIQVLAPAQESAQLARRGLSVVPTTPGLFAKRTLVDAALSESKILFLESGLPGQLIKISGDSFQSMIAGCEVADLAVPVSAIRVGNDQIDDDVDDIHAAIRNYTALRIERRLGDTLEIPPLSQTAQQIIDLSSNPDAVVDDLVAIVELDPGLAGQIVGWAASPYYSAPGKVQSIRDAIFRVLGFELVLNLALGLSVGKTLKVPKDKPNGMAAFWRQSVYCALTAQKLNTCLPGKKRGASGLVYLAGLLNNFGFLVLGHVFPSHFSSLCRSLEANRHLSYSAVERHLLGLTRDQIGGCLLEAWNLPESIYAAVRFQDNLEYQGEQAVYANLVMLAKHLLTEKGIGDNPLPVPDTLYQQLGLDAETARGAVEEVLAGSDEIEVMAQIFKD